MLDFLGHAHVGVGMATAAVLEFVAAGIPVVRVGRTVGLDLDPLAWSDEFEPVAFAPEDIRDQVVRALDLSAPAREALRRRGQALLADLFEPVTEETLGVFLTVMRSSSEAHGEGRIPAQDGHSSSSVSRQRAGHAG